MTDHPNLIALLSNLEAALEDHSYALHAARRPWLTPEEKLAVIRASRPAWGRLEAAWRELDGVAGVEG